MGVKKNIITEHSSITKIMEDVSRQTKEAELGFGDSYNSSVAEYSFEKILNSTELTEQEKINEFIDLKQSILQSITLHQIEEYNPNQTIKENPKNWTEAVFEFSELIKEAYGLISQIEKYIHTKKTPKDIRVRVQEVSSLSHGQLALLVQLLHNEKVFTCTKDFIEENYFKLTGKSGRGYREVIANVFTNSSLEDINTIKLVVENIQSQLNNITPKQEIKRSKKK